MSSAQQQPQVVVVEGHSPEMRLTSWPLADAPLPTAVILALALAGSIAAGIAASSVLFGLASLTALAVALRRLWIPAEFHLAELGVTQTMLGRRWRIPWRAWTGYQIRERGVLLMPDDDRSRIGGLKGLYIPWGEQKEELVALVEHYLRDISEGSTVSMVQPLPPPLAGPQPEESLHEPVPDSDEGEEDEDKQEGAEESASS